MKRIKLALLALLGFSTACTTVRKSAVQPDEGPAGQTEPASQGDEPAPVEAEEVPAIRVMYGVRRPVPLSDELQQQVDSARRAAEERQRSLNGETAPAAPAEEPASER